MARIPVEFSLNGQEKAEFVDGGATLLQVLREKAGELRLSCITLAGLCDGARIETTAGLAQGGVLHPLQRAFAEAFAAQCGFCTPGMIMAAKALLDHNAHPSRDDVIEAISGNICRCTGYEPIIVAILAAARMNSINAA
jgi:carbon-monoxide dehydrogenase small subunit